MTGTHLEIEGGIAWITLDDGKVNAMSPRMLAELTLMAAFALAAHYVFAAAFVRAEVSVLAPFEYTMLLWTIAIGYLVWDELPTLNMWIGAALIIAAGIYVAHRESLRRKTP